MGCGEIQFERDWIARDGRPERRRMLVLMQE
jgi:hypothetical protein